ncbi:MAG: Peptidase Do [candidate division TM6 bacterium GW2011_GWF2_43_17]|nr:MAG: Peptidase Do [candidate division TM6 bacterium GW2011_GWF2_43_17]
MRIWAGIAAVLGVATIGIIATKTIKEQQVQRLLINHLEHELAQRPLQNPPGLPAVNQTTTTTREQERWSTVQDGLRNAVVQVLAFCLEFNWLEPYKTPGQGMGAGSGFFIDQEGHLITNAHVVNQSVAVFIQIPAFGKRRFDVIVEGVAPERDLAVLRVVAEDLEIIKEGLGGMLPIATLGNSDNVKRASEILTLGFPLGQESLKSTLGVVSGRQNMDGSSMIQIDAPINPGNSGGPAINIHGEVVGVNTSGIMNAQNVGYIIPSNEVKLFLDQLPLAPLGSERGIRFLRKPFLGIIYNETNDIVADYLTNPRPAGLYVADVYKGGMLERAGIQKGDMVYQINGHQVDSFGEMQVSWSEDKISLLDYISRLKIGDTLHLVFYRSGERKEITLTFEFTQYPAVRTRYPGYESIDHEVIGGCVFMDLSLNHIPLLIKRNSLLTRYIELENQATGQVILSHVLPDSEATRSRILTAGTLDTRRTSHSDKRPCRDRIYHV